MYTKCKICKKEKLISSNLVACVDCIRENKDNILQYITEIHTRSREEFQLEPYISQEVLPDSKKCRFCANECRIPEGKFGFCGLRRNYNGKIISIGGSAKKGFLDWYYDPLPTNCVADWVCEGSKHYGKKNLAVFYRSCSFNCLFCQNYHFKSILITQIKEPSSRILSAEELADCVDDDTFCICYFGGDPATQISHALQTSRLIRKKRKDIRICWETNGSMNQNLLKLVVELSLSSGGCIKFDLKAYDENLHYALCRTTNKTTLKNFEFVGRYISQRPSPPLLIASTLLVPGYVDEKEVYTIAKFISSIDRNIPYSLLAFYPQFYLYDLPTTSQTHATRAYLAAKDVGLVNVHIGNIHLLSSSNYD